LRKSLARAQQFQAALDVPAAPPATTALHLFAGDARPTPAVVEIQPNGDLKTVVRAPGDDTVLRSSALMDERIGREGFWAPGLLSPVAWSDVTFVFGDHLGMTRDPSFTDNVLYRLLDAPRPGQPQMPTTTEAPQPPGST